MLQIVDETDMFVEVEKHNKNTNRKIFDMAQLRLLDAHDQSSKLTEIEVRTLLTSPLQPSVRASTLLIVWRLGCAVVAVGR